MYQFTETMGAMMPRIKKTYRWYGLGFSLLIGWLPALKISHRLNWGGWGLFLFWILTLITGYQVGKRIPKK